MEEIVFTCSSEDTEFIESIQKLFSEYGSVDIITTSGITGYEKVMLIISAASLIANIVVPFAVANMTNNENDEIKSYRCIIDNNNDTISLEGYDESTIEKIVTEAIHCQNDD